jgi:excisionase family DNA binding protein
MRDTLLHPVGCPYSSMRTLSLAEAAALLHMHPEEVRRRAKLGAIPAAKPGRSWIFIEDDLAEYVRSLYAKPRQALQVTLRKEQECHFANAAASGGSTLSLQTGSEYADLLGLPTRPKRRSFTTG